ncbi:MAG: aminotransferase class I/II-fold pyridoxal phosphate-dependent enzyme [Candidatus Nitrosopelagicus sp.]|nr:aminotransferase class I/II-fold pyridoxal phosphate-dependent enzyme [Candidatus Nitrosopelagicus sp.]
MKSKLDYVNSQLRSIKNNNLYRKMYDVKLDGPYITINSKKLVNFCSNDYLGIKLPKIPSIQNQSSSRLIAGNDELFKIFEDKLAKHKSQDNSLIFPTGYMANLGAISTLINKHDLVLSDELNHASLIEACKICGAKLSIFKHNNIDDLSKKIKQRAKRKFIITEGVFSMDGDFSDLKTISEISQKNNAIIILDDAHGDFTIGNDGKGAANHFKVSSKIDVYISSLSKGLGSFGGYVSSKKNVIDLCINRSKSFIYTSALPTVIINDGIKRFDSNREVKRKMLWKNVKYFSAGLKKIGFNIKSPSHIIPIIVGKEKLVIEFSKYLFRNGIYAQAIRYPTVSHNQARIRISITASLTKKHITDALIVFEKAKKKFQLM